uniref:CCZ1/INTU/HSP4 first Longin domain-containing protein n=1 Tax=Araucaria cunninghamii TaxID=56994 RepID=A0A0D6R5U2_ARACU
MGLTSNSSSEGLQLCVFDMRRGQQEGHELDKILFFFPASCPLSSQLSVIGLSEGLITFTRIFSPEVPCEVIDTDKHSHVFYQPEPDIWMIMVVEKSKEYEEISRHDALQAVLKEAHCLFTMFYGSIRALLEKQPNGATVRSCLYAYFSDYLSDFMVGKKFQMPSFRESLVERGTIQMLSIGRETSLEVQSLVRFLESSFAGSIVRHSLILFHDFLVSTTLPPGDTTNLFTYAVLRLTPNAISSGANSRSYLKKGNLVVPDPVSPVLSNIAHVSDEVPPTSRDTSPVRHDQKFQVPRPLQHDRWWREKDGFLMTDIWGTEIAGRIAVSPTVWLQQTEERIHLCVYQHKNLTIILLIPAGSSVNGVHGISILKQQLLENAYLKILRLEERLSKEWGGGNTYHVAGYRYLFCDNDRNLSRASPPGKVTTLSKSSLAALSKMRAEVDLLKKRSERDDPTQGQDLEVCMRAKNNAWIISRINGGNELYMVLEKASETLLYASDAVEKFSKRYCNGVFSSD